MHEPFLSCACTSLNRQQHASRAADTIYSLLTCLKSRMHEPKPSTSILTSFTLLSTPILNSKPFSLSTYTISQRRVREGKEREILFSRDSRLSSLDSRDSEREILEREIKSESERIKSESERLSSERLKSESERLKSERERLKSERLKSERFSPQQPRQQRQRLLPH
jgi:hypothetical protein